MTEGLFTVFRRKSEPDLEQDKAIRLRKGHVEIRAGRTGEVSGFTRLPQASYWDNSPWREMQWRQSACVRDGYHLAGFGEYVDNRLRMVHEAEPVAPGITPKDDRILLLWSVLGTQSAERLERLFFAIAKRLRGAGVAAQAESRLVFGWPGLSIDTPVRTWKLRLTPTGVLTEAGQQDSAARLLAADGTVPVLVLRRIEQEFPGSLEYVGVEQPSLSQLATRRPCRAALPGIIWLEHAESWHVQPKLALDDPYLGEAVGRFGETVKAARAIGVIPRASVVTNVAGDDQPIVF